MPRKSGFVWKLRNKSATIPSSPTKSLKTSEKIQCKPDRIQNAFGNMIQVSTPGNRKTRFVMSGQANKERGENNPRDYLEHLLLR
jgi:hypothetical protein